MLKKLITAVIIVCVVLGIYKAFDGDIGNILDTGGDILMKIISAGSDVVAKIWDAISGWLTGK